MGDDEYSFDDDGMEDLDVAHHVSQMIKSDSETENNATDNTQKDQADTKAKLSPIAKEEAAEAYQAKADAEMGEGSEDYEQDHDFNESLEPKVTGSESEFKANRQDDSENDAKNHRHQSETAVNAAISESEDRPNIQDNSEDEEINNRNKTAAVTEAAMGEEESEASQCYQHRSQTSLGGARTTKHSLTKPKYPKSGKTKKGVNRSKSTPPGLAPPKVPVENNPHLFDPLTRQHRAEHISQEKASRLGFTYGKNQAEYEDVPKNYKSMDVKLLNQALTYCILGDDKASSCSHTLHCNSYV